jgi:hypothetical protein
VIKILFLNILGMENNRTELIWDNLNPNFAKTFIIDYFFEVQQHIKFEVHHHISKTSSKVIEY